MTPTQFAALRNLLGYTQSEYAAHIGASEEAVSAWERASSPALPPKARALALAEEARALWAEAHERAAWLVAQVGDTQNVPPLALSYEATDPTGKTRALWIALEVQRLRPGTVASITPA